MKILIGLVLLHYLVIMVSKKTKNDHVPYGLCAILSALMMIYVYIMFGYIEIPEE